MTQRINQKCYFTIITATLNAAQTLPKLLQSLKSQTCQDFVWIMQDGASTDDTLAIAKAWENNVPMRIYSEQDTGIYDAWNKALWHEADSLGEWVLFLGADDELASPDILEKVKNFCLTLPPQVLMVAGGVQMIASGEKSEYLTVDPEQGYKDLLWKMIPHSGLFARKESFLSQKFDTSFRIIGDYDWLRRVWTKQEYLRALPLAVTNMCQDGISSNPENKSLFMGEQSKIYKRYGARSFQEWPKFCLILLESYAGPAKLWLRDKMQKNKLSRKCWQALQYFRSLIIGK